MPPTAKAQAKAPDQFETVMLEMASDGTFVPAQDQAAGAGQPQGQGAVGGQQHQAQEGEGALGKGHKVQATQGQPTEPVGKAPAAHGAQQHQPAPVEKVREAPTQEAKGSYIFFSFGQH